MDVGGGAGSKKQHVAFPGGRMEPGDEGEMYTGKPDLDSDLKLFNYSFSGYLCSTAMRTTWEELGIDLAESEWIAVGQMDDREITTSLGKRLLMVCCQHPPLIF